jgi:hypothetical protein
LAQPFEKLYGTAWHHPGVAFAGAVLFAIAFASRRTFLVGWTVLFLVEILADAFATGGFTPVTPGSSLMTGLGIAFVIAGDFRYFLLVEHCIASDPNAVLTSRGLGPWKAWLPAVVVAFIVPLTTTFIREVYASTFKTNDQHTFLLYESLFLVIGLVYRFVVVPRRAKPETRAYLLRLTHFELVQYGLWVAADLAIIFAKLDVGYLVRLVPNAMYYALFLPFAWWMAPRAAREA